MTGASKFPKRYYMKIKRDPAWQLEVGQRLVLARDALRLKAVDLATNLKISQQRLSNYERGERPFDLELAMELSRRYGITMDYIYRGDPRGLPLEIYQRIEPLSVPADTAKH
jgi:transcriptional regulator with XRE-family HTH domain